MCTWTLLCCQICCLLRWENTSSFSTQARFATSSHQKNVGTSQRMLFSSALPSPGRRHGRIPGRMSGNRRNQRGARKPFEVLQVRRVRQDYSRRPSVQQIRHGGDLFSGSHYSVGGDFHIPRVGDNPRVHAGYPLFEEDPRGRALPRFLSVWLSLSLSLSVYLSIYLSIHSSLYLSPVNVSISYLYHPSIPLPVHLFLFIYLSIHISFYFSLSIHRSIYLSIHVSIYPSLPIHLFINPSIFLCLSLSVSIYLSIHPSTYISLSIYLSFRLYIYLFISIFLSFHPSLSLSIYLSIHPSISLSIYQSIRLSIYIYPSIYLCISLYLSTYLSLFMYVRQSIYLNLPISFVVFSFCRAYSSTATAATWPWTRSPRYPRATSSSRPSSSTRNPSIRGQRRRRWI